MLWPMVEYGYISSKNNCITQNGFNWYFGVEIEEMRRHQLQLIFAILCISGYYWFTTQSTLHIHAPTFSHFQHFPFLKTVLKCFCQNFIKCPLLYNLYHIDVQWMSMRHTQYTHWLSHFYRMFNGDWLRVCSVITALDMCNDVSRNFLHHLACLCTHCHYNVCIVHVAVISRKHTIASLLEDSNVCSLCTCPFVLPNCSMRLLLIVVLQVYHTLIMANIGPTTKTVVLVS